MSKCKALEKAERLNDDMQSEARAGGERIAAALARAEAAEAALAEALQDQDILLHNQDILARVVDADGPLDRLLARAEAAEAALASNVSINGVQQTWHQLYERENAQREELEAYRRMVADLSRCEHGRHRGDMCSHCGGPSHGNLLLPPGMIVGHDISGRQYIVPSDHFSLKGWLGEEAGEGSRST